MICSPPEDVDAPDACLRQERAGHLVEFSGHGVHATELSAGEVDGVLGELTVELQELTDPALCRRRSRDIVWTRIVSGRCVSVQQVPAPV